jgi:hypothetical protein
MEPGTLVRIGTRVFVVESVLPSGRSLRLHTGVIVPSAGVRPLTARERHEFKQAAARKEIRDYKTMLRTLRRVERLMELIHHASQTKRR